ncbi:MAG: hypothetical protein RL556_769 [Actinomycetota bacterium]|jgi:zinc/manganese transport system ATP-binding protein
MTYALELQNAALSLGGKQLWSGLNLQVKPGEFVAVIGSNGSGKTSLLKAILGQLPLTAGKVLIGSKPALRGGKSIGYIPQHRSLDQAGNLLAKDLVQLGLDGTKFGIPVSSPVVRRKVKHTLEQIGASELANLSVSELSGGQLQRLRVGQAVISEPKLLLADEPLSALDLHQQKLISELINEEHKRTKAAVLFVTHDVNPILEMVDRVLYLANGHFRIGTPDEVLRSEVLSELYGTQVDVVRNQGRIVVVGTHEHDHHPDEQWA